MPYAAAVALRKGRVDEAADRAGTALTLAEQRGWTLLPAAAMGYMALAVVSPVAGGPASRRAADRAGGRRREQVPRGRLVGPAVALAQARLLLAPW